MNERPFDLGYDAFENDDSLEDNPFDQEKDNKNWEEWRDGWLRCEEDETLRMQTYCAGGADRPTDIISVNLNIDDEEYLCEIEYSIIDEPYYNSEEHHEIKAINCRLLQEIKQINDSEEEGDDYMDEIEDELDLELSELSEENKTIISKLLKLQD
jgi:hypothetical protein